MAGSRWVKSRDGLLWLKSAVKTMESNWAKRSQFGPGPFWLGVKLGQGVKMGRNSIMTIAGIPLEIRCSEVFEKMLNQHFSENLERHISIGILAILTIFILFKPSFLWAIWWWYSFSIQSISFFSNFSFSVKSSEQHKTIVFYETPHHFQRLHPRCQTSPYM